MQRNNFIALYLISKKSFSARNLLRVLVIKKVYKNEFSGIIGFIYTMLYIFSEVTLLSVWKLKSTGRHKSLVNTFKRKNNI